MVALNWLRALVTHRPARIFATAIGVAVGVALIASIGAFLSATNAEMTRRAIARVAVDWQVQVQPGSDATGVLRQVRGYPQVRQALTAQFTQSPGLAATTHGTTQTTGAAQVLGLAPGYPAAFPGELRLLTGTLGGRADRPADRFEPARRARRHRHPRPARRQTRPGHRRRGRRPPLRRLAVSEGRRAAGRAGQRPAGQRADPAAGRVRSRRRPRDRRPPGADPHPDPRGAFARIAEQPERRV